MDTKRWAKMAIHNIASSGKFSSDRLEEYNIPFYISPRGDLTGGRVSIFSEQFESVKGSVREK